MLEWLFGKKKQQPKKQEKNQKQQKKKSKAEQETQDKWMYDFLVQFLNSPLWRVSLLDFVDAKCIVFDNEQENKFEYTTIHNEFKSLVASLFDGMMQEVGLTDEKLVQLLQIGFQSKEKKLFNQLLLCDDFLKFKDLMLRRNKALQDQALKAIQGSSHPSQRKSKIEYQRSIVHESMKSEQERRRKLEQEEEQILRKVLEMSQIEAKEREEIEKLIEKTADVDNMPALISDAEKQAAKQQESHDENEEEERQKQLKQAEEKKKKDQERKQQLRARLNKKKKLDPVKQPVKQETQQSKLADLPPLKNIQPKIEFENQKQEEVKEAKQQEPEVIQTKKQEQKVESQEDRKKRLLQQREKIRKKKQEERKKMLEQGQPQNKVVSIVLQDQGIHDSIHPNRHQDQKKEADEKISKDEIERRRELMRKIKNRIVDDF